MIGIKLDKAVKTLVLIITQTSGYVKKFKVEDEVNKLISFCIDGEKLLGKYKVIWTKIKDLKNIELDALPVYDDRYIKTKIRTYRDNVYTSFCGLNVTEDDVECKSFSWFFTCIRQQLLSAIIFRQLRLQNCKQINDRFSWWKSCWRLDTINALLR